MVNFEAGIRLFLAEFFQFRPDFRLLAKQQDFFDLGKVGKGFHRRRDRAFRGEITPHRIERYFHERFLAGPRGGRIRPRGSR
ncbi:MAG: hypothetical protein RL549_726 [Verrucomicrobiota bacterium]